jgi:hypothetical protein
VLIVLVATPLRLRLHLRLRLLSQREEEEDEAILSVRLLPMGRVPPSAPTSVEAVDEDEQTSPMELCAAMPLLRNRSMEERRGSFGDLWSWR